MATSEPYTGRERRWSQSRQWADWTRRSEHHSNQAALEEARHVAILDKLFKRARNRNRYEEADAIWNGMWEMQQRLAQSRKLVADECAPWFTQEAFR